MTEIKRCDADAKVPGTNVPANFTSYSLKLVERAVLNGWKINAEWKAVLPGVLATIAADSSRSDKVRVKAIEVLARLERDNTEALMHLDKNERLDGGKATENVKLYRGVDTENDV